MRIAFLPRFSSTSRIIVIPFFFIAWTISIRIIRHFSFRWSTPALLWMLSGRTIVIRFIPFSQVTLAVPIICRYCTIRLIIFLKEKSFNQSRWVGGNVGGLPVRWIICIPSSSALTYSVLYADVHDTHPYLDFLGQHQAVAVNGNKLWKFNDNSSRNTYVVRLMIRRTHISLIFRRRRCLFDLTVLWIRWCSLKQ